MSRSNIPERVKSYQFAKRNKSKSKKRVKFASKKIKQRDESPERPIGAWSKDRKLRGRRHAINKPGSDYVVRKERAKKQKNKAIRFGKGRNSAAERRLKDKEKEIQNSWAKWLTHGVGNVAEACTGSRCGLGGGKTRKNNKKKYKKHTKKHKKTKRKRK